MVPDIQKLQQLRRRLFEPTTEVPDREPLTWSTYREFETPSIAETFHEETKLRRRTPTADNSATEFLTDDSLQLSLAQLPPEKCGLKTIELPEPADISVPLDEAITRRRSQRTFGDDPFSLTELGTLLGLACGKTVTITKMDGIEQTFRAHPSGGGLYPVNTYLLVLQETDKLATGIYWYNPNIHALELQREADATFAEEINDALAPSSNVCNLWDAAGIVVLTGRFVRSMTKYGPRGYRFTLQESGHLVQNLLLVATAMELSAFPNASYYDSGLNDLLEVDGVDEATIYTVPMGSTPEIDND